MTDDHTLDLRGVACPLNWARARVVLDDLPRGVRLTLILDDPRAIRDIPTAAEASGFAVVEVSDDGPPWRLTLAV